MPQMQYNPHTDIHEMAPSPQPNQQSAPMPQQSQEQAKPQGNPNQGQQLPQQNTAPQGATQNPDGSQPQIQNPQANDEGIAQAVEQKLNQLPDHLKGFAAGIMVPEMAEFMTEFMGPEVGSVFQKYADPNRVLVSIPKDALTKGADNGVSGDENTADSKQAGKTSSKEEKSTGTAFGSPVDKILSEEKSPQKPKKK